MVEGGGMSVFTEPMARDSMRAEVADSWHLSAAAGVDAERVEAPITLDAAICVTTARHTRSPGSSRCSTTCSARRRATATRSWRSATRPASCCGSAARPRPCARPRRSASSRAPTGTSGSPAPTPPGLALRLGQPALRSAAPSTSGTPSSSGAVRRPRSTTRPRRRCSGVLDITGNDDIAVPQTMAMVRAAARMAESELARELLTRAAAAGAVAERAAGRSSSCWAATRRW